MSDHKAVLGVTETDEYGLPLDLGVEWTGKQRDAVSRLIAVILCELHGIEPFDRAAGGFEWMRFHTDAQAMVAAHPWCGEKIPSA